MAAGFGEAFFGGFAKDEVAGFGEDDDGVANESGGSAGSGEFVLPENITGFEIHAVKLGVVSLVAKATDEVIADEEGVLEDHGEIAIAVNDFWF